MDESKLNAVIDVIMLSRNNSASVMIRNRRRRHHDLNRSHSQGIMDCNCFGHAQAFFSIENTNYLLSNETSNLLLMAIEKV